MVEMQFTKFIKDEDMMVLKIYDIDDIRKFQEFFDNSIMEDDRYR